MTTPYASNRTDARGGTASVNDLELYHEEYGAGAPLVLLHGFGGSCRNWHPFVDELAGRYRLIVIDLRGHGASTNPRNEFTHRQAAQDVFLLLDQLGIQRFAAMGISSGGMVLLHMATERPSRLETMVLVSATTHFPPQARAIMRRASFETMPEEVREMYRLCATRGDPQIRQLLAQFNALAENDDDMSFTAAQLSTIEARTLVVHGDRDQFFPVEIPVGLFRALRRAALWIVPGGAHVPIYESEVPFVATALRFLEGSR